MTKPNYKLAKLQQDFKTFYDANLRQKYEELEPARQKYLNRFLFRSVVSVGLILLTIFLCYTGVISKQIYDSEGFMKIFSLILVLMCFFCYTPFVDYCSDTKSLVMDKILSFWGTFKYSRSSTVSNSDIEKSELFAQYNSDVTDDSFKGTYNNTNICVAEKNLRVKGSKNDYSIFKGVIIVLNFSKKFKGKTVVKHRGNFASALSNHFQLILMFFLLIIALFFLAQIFPLAEDGFERGLFLFVAISFCFLAGFGFYHYLKKRKKATQKVALEEISFNKDWRVLTSDQIEARYILTPTFMEKINDVKKLFHGRHVNFSFFNSKLLIAIHTSKDMFETTSLFTPALDYAKVREVVSQLYSIFTIIDVLGAQK